MDRSIGSRRVPALGRRHFLQGIAALGALAAAGRPHPGWSQSAGRLRVRVERDLQTLDPAYQIGHVEETINEAVLVTLVVFKEDGTGWEPYAAESIEQIDDRHIRFRLRPGIMWSNGFGELTAEDVKFSFERIADPKNESPWQYAWDLLERVEVVDSHSGVIVLKEPFAPVWQSSLPWYAGHIVCRKAVEAAGGRYSTEPPAICGPYKIGAWEPQRRIVLSANPDWNGPAPAFPEIDLVIVKDDQAGELAYAAGGLDFTRIGALAIERYRSAPPADARLIERPAIDYVWLGLNVEHPNLQDIRVRQAIQYAVDVDSVLEAAYGGMASRATGFMAPHLIGCRERNLIAARDLDRARGLLAEAGVGTLNTTITVLSTVEFVTMAQVIQANLAEIGIGAEIYPYDEGAFWNLGIEAEGEAWKDLEIFVQRFNGGVDPSENAVWFTCAQVGVWNWQRWCSEEYDALYAAALREVDPAARGRMYARMQDLLEESGSVLFLTNETQAVVHKAEIVPALLPDCSPFLAHFRRA